MMAAQNNWRSAKARTRIQRYRLASLVVAASAAEEVRRDSMLSTLGRSPVRIGSKWEAHVTHWPEAMRFEKTKRNGEEKGAWIVALYISISPQKFAISRPVLALV
jgi:hypothetical protein